MTLLFLFDLFLEGRAEILEKLSMVFLEDLKTSKGHFEINRPLTKVLERRLLREYQHKNQI